MIRANLNFTGLRSGTAFTKLPVLRELKGFLIQQFVPSERKTFVLTDAKCTKQKPRDGCSHNISGKKSSICSINTQT